MQKKKVATSAQRRAFRSITTKSERQNLRSASGSKGSYAKRVAQSGSALRKDRIAKGLNPNTGKKATAARAHTRIKRV